MSVAYFYCDPMRVVAQIPCRDEICKRLYLRELRALKKAATPDCYRQKIL